MSNSVWAAACRLLSEYLTRGRRLDFLLEGLPPAMTGEERRRVRHWLYGVVRHLGLLEHVVQKLVHRRPRARLRAILLLGTFELMEHPESAPLIVHHAVAHARGFGSPAEAGMINAVLRRAAVVLEELMAAEPDDAAALALRFSHPAWLVERWLAQFGPEGTRDLLAWNQTPAPVHARLVDPDDAAQLPAGFTPTRWPGFFLLERPEWSEVETLLAAGRIYLQDPATALAARLLAPAPGETVADLCAAPGGKTLMLAAAVGRGGRVFAVDLPGPRLERLCSNLRRHPDLPVSVVGADATTLTLPDAAALGLPPLCDAVLADVPCSNTGVLRHRVDAKWRLRSGDITQLAGVQGAILERAASLVRPGGRLVYSTCSLEREENEAVVGAFLERAGGAFALIQSEQSLPWESGCDGAGAFLLQRRAG